LGADDAADGEAAGEELGEDVGAYEAVGAGEEDSLDHGGDVTVRRVGEVEVVNFND
jgi:hypothetical protein